MIRAKSSMMWICFEHNPFISIDSFLFVLFDEFHFILCPRTCFLFKNQFRPKDVRLICRDGMPKWNNHIPFRFSITVPSGRREGDRESDGESKLCDERRYMKNVPMYTFLANTGLICLHIIFNYEYFAVFPNLFTCFRKKWFCERHLNDIIIILK